MLPKKQYRMAVNIIGAIAFTLVEQGNELTIVCRTKEKGDTLAGSLNKFFHPLTM